MPAALVAGIRGVSGRLSIADSDIGSGLWKSIKRVWASKWTERAYLSRKSCGIDDDDLYMAVLLMKMVPALPDRSVAKLPCDRHVLNAVRIVVIIFQ